MLNLELKMRKNLFLKQKGQISAFVIVGLLIVIGILILFFLRKPPKIELADENKPQAYVESCVRDATIEAINLTSFHGGDINPKGGLIYNGRELVYLCSSSEYYKLCINQRPLLIEHIENEITNYITPKIEKCFTSLNTNLEGRYQIDTDNNLKVETKLRKKQVSITVYKKFTMTREDKALDFNNFRVDIVHPIYDLAKIANEIANQESQYCNFDTLGYMIIYPEYNLDRIPNPTGEPDVIYNIKDRKTNQEFTFAIRSCAKPAGL
jgi:hypothetical protein